MKKEQEQKCFIITPIGNDTDPIRRHIDGIFEAAIRPALEDKYQLIVAHKIYEPGSITKQVISEIYDAELVIANLTNRNPNVMYELAFRHSLGKPVIMIAEAGTSLPADIIMERTIFYQNDAQGVLDLKEAIEKAESEINFSKIGSPIYDVLNSIDRDKHIIQLSQNDPETAHETLPYILDKLNKLEDMLVASRTFNSKSSVRSDKHSFIFTFSNVPERGGKRSSFCDAVFDTAREIPQIHLKSATYDHLEKECRITFDFHAAKDYSVLYLRGLFEKAFSDAGYEVAGMDIEY